MKKMTRVENELKTFMEEDGIEGKTKKERENVKQAIDTLGLV